jgi:hypothetical protein
MLKCGFVAMEWLIGAGIAWVLWTFLGAKGKRSRSSRQRSRDYRPDPLAHLDIKPSDNSITAGKFGIRKREESDWDYLITYRDQDGEITTRRIRDVGYTGGADPMITAFCEMRMAERNFRASRIISCVNLQSGRAIKDFGTYLKRGYGWR